jgi:1-acyl-sn-glycerol-3-phosphate acyltransferase
VIRSAAFLFAYYFLSVSYVFMATLSVIFPGKLITRWIVRRYAQRMLWAMKAVAGIRVEHRGLENLPKGAFILAPKHQSWGDGFASFSVVDDLVFVTGNHLEKIPLLKGLLRKIGAIVVDSCGGGQSKEDLMRGAEQAFAEGKRILIYPEGHLSKPGTHHRYRLGIYALYSAHHVPVVPAGTNLGCFWEQTQFNKTPGNAVVEYLEPIPPGLSKAEFMKRLEESIEGSTRKLFAEAKGVDPGPSTMVHFAKEKTRASAS